MGRVIENIGPGWKVSMKKLTAILVLLTAMLSVVGCHHWKPINGTTTKVPNWNPKVEDLVAYLNDNASRVKAIQSNSVAIDAKMGSQGIGASGLLVFEKPRNFRLKARVIGKEAVDMGSNNEEFWFWSADDRERFVNYCSYANLAKGNVPIPPFFQPELIIAALGVQEYNPQGKYEMKINRDTIELIEATTSPQGQPMQKVVTFARAEAGPGEPQVKSLALRDAQNKDIVLVQYLEVQIDRGTNAILPYRMKIILPTGKERAELTLRLSDLREVNLQPQQAQRLFNRADLMQGRTGFDMARGVADGATGSSELRPVGARETQPKR